MIRRIDAGLDFPAPGKQYLATGGAITIARRQP
jgi:hypothetical protein